MPTYQLRCVECLHEFEDVHKISEPHPPCPKCEAETQVHMIKPPTVIFKGSGWASKDIKSERRLTSVL